MYNYYGASHKIYSINEKYYIRVNNIEQGFKI